MNKAAMFLAVFLPSLAVLFTSVAPHSVRAAVNPIQLENQQPGTTQWQLGGAGFLTSDDVSQQIEGYASATSVPLGSSLAFYITVNPVQTYTIDVYRMGWYGGTGGRLLLHVGASNGVQQPSCPIDSTTGLRACSWAPSYTLSVPTTWTTGIYLALLTNQQNYQSYIIFTVRDDARAADLLFLQSVNTYQAYSDWPNDNLTGKSLYAYNSYGPNSMAGGPQAVKVSFDRPYSDYNGAGRFFDWDIYLVHWLERQGYDVSYTTDVDVDANGARLLNFKGFVSAGHSEYWTKSMYDSTTNARDSGINLAFFGANAIYWQARYEPNASGMASRVLVCYRDANLDPTTDLTLKTVNWRSPPLNRPEQQLIGIMYTSLLNSNTTYVVSNSSNWVYANTGFKDRDKVSGIVGYEVDRNWSTYPQAPAVTGTFTLLSQSPVTNSDSVSDVSNSSVYQATSGAWVFASGTMSWSWALDRAGYVDSRIQQATTNVLAKFLASGGTSTPAPTPTPTTVMATATVTSTVTATATATASGATSTPTPTATATPTQTSTSINAPSALSAQRTGGTGNQRVNLSWTSNSTNQASFTLQRSTTASFASPASFSVAGTTTSYADQGAFQSGTTYFYRVFAVTATGVSSSASNTASVTAK